MTNISLARASFACIPVIGTGFEEILQRVELGAIAISLPSHANLAQSFGGDSATGEVRHKRGVRLPLIETHEVYTRAQIAGNILFVAGVVSLIVLGVLKGAPAFLSLTFSLALAVKLFQKLKAKKNEIRALCHIQSTPVKNSLKRASQ